ncbi:unnamed protein product [Phytophthora fragariaefolia]|uniref:Unnamed protein product n=1 Tax=Phytophthora fragariaefolia TaxID=1490495 RepID=A0A9W6U2M8_9STRA|nr:unnamed protein product [Phytophthora fragariaefolia]
MVPLAHPNPNMDVWLYTDASQDYWGAAVTQLPAGEAQRPLAKQDHRPLAFLSGRFVGAARRWWTIEKAACAIVEATRRLEYLLLRPRGFRQYTDHRDLVYIFNPYPTDGTMARYQADKLQRWALSLMSFQYIIEHVPREVNLWGDLLSRWGAGQVREDKQEATRVVRLAVVERVSPSRTPSSSGRQRQILKQSKMHHVKRLKTSKGPSRLANGSSWSCPLDKSGSQPTQSIRGSACA